MERSTYVLIGIFVFMVAMLFFTLGRLVCWMGY